MVIAWIKALQLLLKQTETMVNGDSLKLFRGDAPLYLSITKGLTVTDYFKE